MRSRVKFIAVLALAFVAALLTTHPQAHAASTVATPPPAQPAMTLYLGQCAVCHGSTGTGTSRGPSLVGVGAADADLMIRTGRMPLASPTQRVKTGKVPYTNTQIEQLDSIVASFGAGPGIPSSDLTGADVAKGGDLFNLNCSACHGVVGGGGVLDSSQAAGGTLHAPALTNASASEVLEAMRAGPGDMPKFRNTTMSDAQARDIAAYVLTLHQPKDSGGWSLAHMGPVAEGAIGLIVGLGLLILAIRWIGVPST